MSKIKNWMCLATALVAVTIAAPASFADGRGVRLPVATHIPGVAHRKDFPVARAIGHALNNGYLGTVNGLVTGMDIPAAVMEVTAIMMAAGEYARAYRDVGIADAVVGVVGALTYPRAVYAAPVYGAPAYTTVVRGHYETQRRLLHEGYTEQYKVYVDPTYDTHTGRLIDGGYYETRSRTIPAQWEERQVWVDY